MIKLIRQPSQKYPAKNKIKSRQNINLPSGQELHNQTWVPPFQPPFRHFIALFFLLLLFFIRSFFYVTSSSYFVLEEK